MLTQESRLGSMVSRGRDAVELREPPESEMHTSQEGKASITLLPLPEDLSASGKEERGN
jgi:hypothetical protein